MKMIQVDNLTWILFLRQLSSGGNGFEGFFGVLVMKLTISRLIDGSPCGGIDMVIKDLDLEPKIDATMRDFLNSYVLKMKSFVEQLKPQAAKGKGKGRGEGKNKLVYAPKPKNPKPAAKEHPKKDDFCHHCKEVGHWRRNCHVYLAELIKKKKQVGAASTSESFKPPEEDVAPVRRSVRTHRALKHLCLNVEVEDHSLWDLNEPANYKAALLDLKSNKWLDAMSGDAIHER
nr:zinc finger, CCHC-type [Tanacetum cinerariifolium]